MMTFGCCILLVGLAAVQGGLLYGQPEKLGGLGLYGGLGHGAQHEALGYGEKFYGGNLGGYGGKLYGGHLGGFGGKFNRGYLGGYGYGEGSLGLAKGLHAY